MTIPLPFVLNRARVELAFLHPVSTRIPLVDSSDGALRALAGVCAGRYAPRVPVPGDLGRLLSIAAGLGDPAVKGTPTGNDHLAIADYNNPPRRFRHPLAYRLALHRLERLVDRGD